LSCEKITIENTKKELTREKSNRFEMLKEIFLLLTVLGFMSAAPFRDRYVSGISGSDTTGDGSKSAPWQTLQFAYDSITDARVGFLYSIHVETPADTVPIIGKPNIYLMGWTVCIIAQPLTIEGVVGNDQVGFQDIVFDGLVTWNRNDYTQIELMLDNAGFSYGLNYGNAGAGGAFFAALDSVFIGGTFQCPSGAVFVSPTMYAGSLTFLDAGMYAYYEFLGGYLGGPLTLSGGAYAYFSGVQADVPYGYTLTTVAGASGTPIIQTDASSIPTTISGPHSLILTTQASNVNFQVSDATKWASPSPTTTDEAINRIAAIVGQSIPIPLL